MDKRLDALRGRLRQIGGNGLCVAFSGGTDSALLLRVAKEELGDRVCAVTFSSRLNKKAELAQAKAFARALQVRHEVLVFDEFEDGRILDNPPDRCYFCKKYIFTRLRSFCDENGLGAVADGTNADDLAQYRPGLRALRELRVASPLAECGFTKAEVRALARRLGLSVSEKPSAPCLATRVPYGTRLTNDLLKKIETAENGLEQLGFAVCRVRAHGEVARIEVPAGDLARAAALREKIVGVVRRAGFAYAALDLEGFRSGSMDRALGKDKKER